MPPLSRPEAMRQPRRGNARGRAQVVFCNIGPPEAMLHPGAMPKQNALDKYIYIYIYLYMSILLFRADVSYIALVRLP